MRQDLNKPVFAAIIRGLIWYAVALPQTCFQVRQGSLSRIGGIVNSTNVYTSKRSHVGTLNVKRSSIQRTIDVLQFL